MEPQWHVENSRSGVPTAWLNGKALHSRFDPVKEAEKAAEQVPDNAAIVVLAGLGLGYVAEALRRRVPGRTLIIAEADPEMPARTAAVRDIAGLLRDPDVTIVAGGDPGDVRGLLTGGPSGSLIHLLEWKPSLDADPDWYRRLAEAVEETSRRRAVNARTLERFGRLWVRNLAANAELLPRAVSLEPWHDRFTGIPALVLAGGPSLEQILPHLPDAAERCLIIAVDTAVPAVLRSGVKPDVIAAVDPQYWNTRHLDRCSDGAGDALVLAESATHPAVFRRLGGRPWLMRTRFPLGTHLENAAGIRGELKAGGSVATAAWDLARHLGCRPMVIAGLDLGFPGRRTHYSGSLSRERPHMFSTRTAPGENAFYHALHDASPYTSVNTAGSPILTDRRMDVYAAWFADSVAVLERGRPGVVGLEGRKIDGMEAVSIEALVGYPPRRKEIDAALRDVRSHPVDPGAEKRVSDSLKRMTSALQKLQNRAIRGADAAAQAAQALKDGVNPAPYLTDMERIDQQILEGEGRDIISFLIQPIILEITGSEDQKDGDPLAVSSRLYHEMAESAAYHVKYLQRALDQ